MCTLWRGTKFDGESQVVHKWSCFLKEIAEIAAVVVVVVVSDLQSQYADLMGFGGGVFQVQHMEKG